VISESLKLTVNPMFGGKEVWIGRRLQTKQTNKKIRTSNFSAHDAFNLTVILPLREAIYLWLS